LRRYALKIPAMTLILALALAGCGRKGPLEAPNTAVPTAEMAKVDTNSAITPLPKQQKPETPKQEVPNKPFFLDFLL